MLDFIMGFASDFLFDVLDKKNYKIKKLMFFCFFYYALLFFFCFLLGLFFNKAGVGLYMGVLLSVGIGFFSAVFMFLHKRFNK
ncbi:hypothetical protein EWD94_21500 [Salmonella enterica subsp. enterica serovar Newport]|uniref:Uncharacterized protein n=1 Tax=Salmonella newport TaxID=108619 RepID=A0A5U9VYP5_SALNE|nr:hypothetical protein [Salmonella enterica subsp. enterica serovar Newport]ECB3301591.1 hypothetical protein [Salmonella enterica subsp. enterica serovar Newport]